MKVKISKSPDGKGKFVSKLQKFTAAAGGVPPQMGYPGTNRQEVPQESLINFIASDIAAKKNKQETIIKLLPILGNDYNMANSYYDQIYQAYASQKIEDEDEEEDTDEATEYSKVEIANSPITQSLPEKNETKLSNEIIAEDTDDSDFDDEIYSDYENPNAETPEMSQSKLGGDFKRERKKYVNNILKLAKKELGGSNQIKQSSTPDPTGSEFRDNIKGSFVNTLKNNAQLAVIKEEAENNFDQLNNNSIESNDDLTEARLGFNKRGRLRNSPYYMSPFMGLTPDMIPMGTTGPISKLDVSRSHWLTGKPTRYSMEFSPMPGMGTGYYTPGYGYGKQKSGTKSPGRIVTETISKEINNKSIEGVGNTIGPKNWNEADYNNDNIPDYLQPDGAGTEDLAMGRNVPAGPVENPNDPTAELPTKKVINKPKKKESTPDPVPTGPIRNPNGDPFGFGQYLLDGVKATGNLINEGLTTGIGALKKLSDKVVNDNFNRWAAETTVLNPEARTRERFFQEYPTGAYNGKMTRSAKDLNIKPTTGLDENDYLTYLFPGAFRYTIPAAAQAFTQGTKLLNKGVNALGPGQKMLNQGQGMLNTGQKMLSTGQKLLNPPAGFQFKLPFQIGGSVNDPFADPYGNLQKFIYGGDDDFSQADLDYVYSKDTTDPYFQYGGLLKAQKGIMHPQRAEELYGQNNYDAYSKQIGDRLGMSLRDDLSAKEMYELAQKAGINNNQSNTRNQTNINRNINPNNFNAGYNRGQFPGMYYDPRIGYRGPSIFPGRFASYAGTYAKPIGMRTTGTNQPYTGSFDPTGVSRINVTKSNRRGVPKRYTIDYNVPEGSTRPKLYTDASGNIKNANPRFSPNVGSTDKKEMSSMESVLQRETEGMSGKDLRVTTNRVKDAFRKGYGSDYQYDDSRDSTTYSTNLPASTAPKSEEDKQYSAEFEQKQKDRGLVWNAQQNKWVPNSQNMATINAATDPNYLTNQRVAGNAMQQMFSNASNLSDYSGSPRQSNASNVTQQTPTASSTTQPVTTSSNPLAAFIQSAMASNKQNELPQQEGMQEISTNPGFNLPMNRPSPRPEFGIDNNNQYIDLPDDYRNAPNIEGTQNDLDMKLRNMRNAAYPEWATGRPRYQPGGEFRRIYPGLSENLDGLRNFFNRPSEEDNLEFNQQIVEETPVNFADAYSNPDNFQELLPYDFTQEDAYFENDPIVDIPFNDNIKKSKRNLKKKSNKATTDKKNNNDSEATKKALSNSGNSYDDYTSQANRARKAKQDTFTDQNYKTYEAAKRGVKQYYPESDVAKLDNQYFIMQSNLDRSRDKELKLLNKTNKTEQEKKELAALNKTNNDLSIKASKLYTEIQKKVDTYVAGKNKQKRLGGTLDRFQVGGIKCPMGSIKDPVTGFCKDVSTGQMVQPITSLTAPSVEQMTKNPFTNTASDPYKNPLTGESAAITNTNDGYKYTGDDLVDMNLPGNKVSVDYRNKNMYELNPEIGVLQFNTGLSAATGLKNMYDTKLAQNQVYNKFSGDATAAERRITDKGGFDTNSGLYQPDQMGFEGVISRFGGSIYEDGGSVYDDIDEGDEVMMTPEQLQEFLANGGEVEYLNL